MSTITVTGRLTYDPELRFTPSGKAVVNLRIAENHSRRMASGSFEDAGTTFYNVTRWAPAADNSVEVEAIASSLHRGDLVLITGRFSTRDYTTRDGESRVSLEITAEGIGATVRGQSVTVTRAGRAETEEPGEYQPVDEPAL